MVPSTRRRRTSTSPSPAIGGGAVASPRGTSLGAGTTFTVAARCYVAPDRGVKLSPAFRRRCDSARVSANDSRLLQLAHHPARGVDGEVGEILEELLDVGAGDARTEVLLQEAVEVLGDALREEPAAAQRRDDEPLYRAEAAAARQVAGDLLALVREAREHRRGIDADLRPDLQERRKEALRITVDQAAGALEREVLELGLLLRTEARHTALDVLHAVRVVARLVAGHVRQ